MELFYTIDIIHLVPDFIVIVNLFRYLVGGQRLPRLAGIGDLPVPRHVYDTVRVYH